MDLARGSVGALLVRVGGTACLLGFQVLLARLLGAEGFGDYVYALSWVQVLALVTTVGLDTASLRFLAAYRAEGKWGLLRGFLRRSTALTAAVSLAVGGALVAALTLGGDELRPALLRTFLLAAVLLPAHALLLLLSSQLRGLKQVVRSMLPTSVLRPAALAALVVTLHLTLPRSLGPVEVMVLDVSVTVLLLVLTALWLRRACPRQSRVAAPSFATRHWLAVSVPLLAVAGVRMLMNRADILLVGALMGTESAGLYTAASQISTLIGFGLLAVNMIAAPLFAELWTRGDRRELQRIVRLSARGVFVFSCLGGLFLLLSGRQLLSIYGPEFVSSYPPLAILVASQMVSSVAGSVGFLLSMTGHEWNAARVTVASGVLNVVLHLLLIPILGLVGAALATATANLVWNLSLVFVVRSRLGINSLAFGGRPA